MASDLKTDCPYGFQIFSFDLLIVGMVDETLPHSLRSTFTLLCQRLYIDRFPHSELQVPRLVRVWSEVDRSVDLNKASTLPQVAACALTPPVVLCATLQMMRPACTFNSLCHCIADSTYMDRCVWCMCSSYWVTTIRCYKARTHSSTYLTATRCI